MYNDNKYEPPIEDDPKRAKTRIGIATIALIVGAILGGVALIPLLSNSKIFLLISAMVCEFVAMVAINSAKRFGGESHKGYKTIKLLSYVVFTLVILIFAADNFLNNQQ